MSDVIWRRFSVQWNGLPVANLAVFVVGGLMYAAMSTSQALEMGLPIGATAWASAMRALSARST